MENPESVVWQDFPATSPLGISPTMRTNIYRIAPRVHHWMMAAFLVMLMPTITEVLLLYQVCWGTCTTLQVNGDV